MKQSGSDVAFAFVRQEHNNLSFFHEVIYFHSYTCIKEY